MDILLNKWKKDFADVARPEKIAILSSFFKTGAGEYGEGDVFIGVTVPDNRAIALHYTEAPLSVVEQMLKSEVHEHRLSALLCLVAKYPKQQAEITDFYIKHAQRANNWDLVDLSAPKIIGEELRAGRCHNVMRNFSTSASLWQRRIAIVSTLQPVTKDADFALALEISNALILDNEPLIHKAVGWILREVGKNNLEVLRNFLHEHISQISSTTLSYATERMAKPEREALRCLRKDSQRRTGK